MTPTMSQVAVMVGTHAAAVILEVAAILLWWHFAELAEQEAGSVRTQLDEERGRAESARAEGIEREALTERQRAEANAGASQRLGLEAHRIRERAEAAAAAVASLDHQAGMLRQSVQEIAQRCQQAATTAATGQETTDAAGGVARSAGSSRRCPRSPT